MSYGLIDHDTLEDIATAIRIKANSEAQYYPRNMANAILQIITGGEGFQEPVGLNLKHINYGTFPPIDTAGLMGVEVMTDSELDALPDKADYPLVAKNIEWTPMSPGKIDLHFHSLGQQTGYKYYFVIPDGFDKKKVSFIDMTENCTYNANLRDAFCGTYTARLYRTFYSCTNTELTEAVCGPNVEDMSYAYAYCSYLLTAKCGENVKNMSNAYYSCSRITHAEIGPNVEKVDSAYCYNNTVQHDIVIPEKVTDMHEVFLNNEFIPNIAILTDKFPETNTIAYVSRAFSRSYYTVRRNVVVTNRKTYDIVKNPSYYVFSSDSGVEYTEEDYEELVTVTVNNVDYLAYSCAYNTTINTYIYCTAPKEEQDNSIQEANNDNNG